MAVATLSRRSRPLWRPRCRGNDAGKDGITTGASNDIQRATEVARNMVTKWGLSENMGPLMYDEGGEEVFLGRSAAQPAKAMSDETALAIDKEVRSIIDDCYDKAHQLLEDNRDKLDMMADALMQYETIDAEQIDDIMEAKRPVPVWLVGRRRAS